MCEKDGSWWTCMVPRTKFKMPTTSRSRLSTAKNSPYQHCGHCRPGAYPTLGVQQPSPLSFLPMVESLVISWGMLSYRLYHVFVLIYLIVFITDCFIRKWCTKRILIPSTFVGSFCLSNWFLYLLVGCLYLLSGCLVGCLVICFLWLVGRSDFVGWLVLVHSDGWCWLTARLTTIRSINSLVSQNTSPALITKAGSPGVSGHSKFETLLIV